MDKDIIIIKRVIVHILDSTIGLPVLSDLELDCGSELCDFFKGHISKITESDEIKFCKFVEESEVYGYFKDYDHEFFVDFSKILAQSLYGIMNSNIEIPAGDLAVVLFQYEGKEYIGLLKLNYRAYYTHLTDYAEGRNNNGIILQRAILPSETQKLSEAIIVCMDGFEIQLLERKYEINGAKEFYLSKLFLQCQAPLSQKSKLDIVTRAVEQVNKKFYSDEDVDRKMEIKNIIYSELEEQGGLAVEAVKQKVFADAPEMQQEFEQKLEKYNMQNEEIKPQNSQTIKKFQKQVLTTDTGIEISIPMEIYQNRDNVQFVTHPDGSISLSIKNIGKVLAK